jgi:hypothetical protein
VGGSEIFTLNMYNNDRATTVSFLRREGLVIPCLSIMAGNFNCHSMVWDPSYNSHGVVAACLFELTQDLELDWDPPVNPSPTHIPHVEALNHTVIDLIFTPPGVAIELPQRRLVELQGPSDHIPLLSKICIRPSRLEATRITIQKESDEEDAFLGDLYRLMRGVSALPIRSKDRVKERANALALAFSTAWDSNVVEMVIKSHSKGWWSKECLEAIKRYWESHNPWHYKQFQLVIKDTKQVFFDKQINKVASLSKRPWDLMSWVKQRNLPPMESILFRDEPCNTLDSLWNALHSTYNAASGHECEMESLDEWPAFPEREWLDFTPNEIQVALAACAKNSAPGLDHIMWSHLKLLLADVETCTKVVDLANACFEQGHWPTIFKESSSVIIPKLGKLSYAAPKAFRPIVLLNTMGKLIKKCVLNRIQFDCVKYGVFQSNQFGGIMQRSTKDAGLYLTHLVKASWARGLKTSMITFDIAQFFPSLNHGMLMAIFR